MTGALVTEVLRDGAALAALEADWWSLWRRARAATPFQSPAWLIPWWREFRPGALLTLAVREQGRLVGLAPFYVEQGPLGRRLLPVGISLSDHLDVLLDPDCERGAAAALAEAASREGGWERWELEELQPGAAAFALPLPEGCFEERASASACPVLALPEGAANLADALPRKKRRDLNQARSRAARRGEVAVEAATALSAPAFLGELFRLHALRWESRGEAGVLADDPVRRFHHAALPGLMAAGLLRLRLLRIGGRAVAAYHGFPHRGREYAYLTGFDPEYDFESPGMILTAHAFEEARAEGAREIHFLRGQETYKYGWGAVDRWNGRRSFRRTASLG